MGSRGSFTNTINVFDFNKYPLYTLSIMTREVETRIGDVKIVLEKNFEYSNNFKEAIELAGQEALRLRHNYIGTEHLLLGLVRQKNEILIGLGVSLEKARLCLEMLIGRGDNPVFIEEGGIRLTPRADWTISHAGDEQRIVRSQEVDSNCLLLSLVREGQGIAAGVLESLGVSLEEVRTRGYPG